MIHFYNIQIKREFMHVLTKKKLEILCYVLQYLEKHTLLIYFNAKFWVSLVGPISKCENSFGGVLIYITHSK